MRNYETFPASIIENANEDIDILCLNKEEFIKKMEAYPILPQKTSYNFYTFVRNQKIYIDIRTVGDGYYDPKWANNMLKNRVLKNNTFYVMDDINYKYSLLYHILIQKENISLLYAQKMQQLFKCKNLSQKEWLHILSDYMYKKGYKCTKPNDPGVLFNKKNAFSISANIFFNNILNFKTIDLP